MTNQIPLICFEDEHLLVVNKPAGLNTHAPSAYAGEGIYDWLRHREPRWARLAILQRLDKETSGVLVFGKSTRACQSLNEQFATRAVRKKYLFVTDRTVPSTELTVTSALVRAGEKYLSRPTHAGGEIATTRFRVLSQSPAQTVVEAEPITGRTHQIRVQAAERGFPILGDTFYGGTPALRVCLHAQELAFKHPATGAEMTFTVPVDFAANTRLQLREAVIEKEATTAYRLIHGAADGWPGWYVDRLGDFLLSQSAGPLNGKQRAHLAEWREAFSLRSAYHRILSRTVRGASPDESSPKRVLGEAVPERFLVRENGIQFELSFGEGYSTGLFLDQRDNRRRLLVNHVGADFPLFTGTAKGAEVFNTFAYSCAFSVCAAKAGARVTSLDLSRKYLEWGKRNFALNGLDAAAHDFIYGDVFDWLARFARKLRCFDVILLDPPTFSSSKESGVFRAEKDYGRLVSLALPLLKSGGVLFASTNAAGISPEQFLGTLLKTITAAGRTVTQSHYVPQPPDFPISRAERAHLKTAWLTLA